MRHATASFAQAVFFATAMGGIDGLVDRHDDVGHGDVGGLATQRIAAARATGGLHQVVATQLTEQLFGKLRRHDLVESTRGPGGGYTLGRKASEITVADIIVSVDEPIDATHCGGKENCLGDSGRCMTHELWASLNQRMVEFLDSVTLQKLVDDQLAKGVQIEDSAKPALRRAISSTPVVKPIRVNAPNSVFALGTALAKS